MNDDAPTSSTAAREAENVRDRYARRDGARDANRYSLSDPYALAVWQERQRKMLRMLAEKGLRDLGALDVLDLGCGSGGNLLDLLRLGVAPDRLQGIELLAERAEAARAVLPASCSIWNADALTLDIPAQSQDVIVLFTVFSSILSDTVQQQIADQAWRWLRPGGVVLWHDFVYDNPRNPDVRAVPLTRVRALFPEAHVRSERITLAPPLGRAACRMSPALYPLLNAIPLLRTHVLCTLAKPL
ncbi:class I SAM-dependent methyltransferase [Diaphorobacter sp. HDW4A]|uniref:class I SAM-dependent methyltransferase n=1 Tax=Diaphorobacter sp. HDW4A TaxID=2714924 RepID=UPI00140DADE8|nr:class I SAM-dependent methyltransferase [Diaphorobacter sp. HDW4A]QIL78707.1 class I SAM-dependent methyltransferase [Diaphorobacter sp. HDW4A]